MSGGAAPTHRFSVPADHPALPGHFPGRPILPGVLLLDAVLLAAGCAHGRGISILRAKFTAPVGPGDQVEIALKPREAGTVLFTCRRGGSTVLTGELACPLP
ncbi:hypothetical protein [Siccirubricoccus phaeus]|uniref:hypothetical protein n=1 Tax=Siccirubricoccus phaeus TaxID=2595053 RepID=UPI00165A3400|nr:hypothetical protein [Siccirubricoccus phaeus]